MLRFVTTDTNLFNATLACPRCDAELVPHGSAEFQCRGCKQAFPLLNGIPWLFAEPAAALADWRQRYDLAIKTEHQAIDSIDASLGRVDLLDLTRSRLAAQRTAHVFQADALAELLQPLQGLPASGEIATYLALRTRLPTDQGLNTYFPNVHRDWSWGDEENGASADLVCAALGDRASNRKLLVLGAGAGRLTYDLHCRLQPQLTVALDFNPMLMLLASRLTAGDSVDLYEFPLAPLTHADHALRRTLKAPDIAPGGLHYLLGDALRPPLREAAFDVVVTPWVTDIVSEDLSAFAPRINHLLCKGGQWVNFGSLAFRNADPANCYSLEETVDVIAASGFASPHVQEAEISYLRSPASRHSRRERVVTLVTEKNDTVAAPAKHRALPDWIVTGKAPVPASQAFQLQAASTRIHAYIMSMIDGKRSLEDMAALMEQQKLMGRDDARGAIQGFLIKMFDDANRYSGY